MREANDNQVDERGSACVVKARRSAANAAARHVLRSVLVADRQATLCVLVDSRWIEGDSMLNNFFERPTELETKRSLTQKRSTVKGGGQQEKRRLRSGLVLLLRI